MLSSALFMFPSMISTSLPHRRASYVSGVVRYILASLFCFFVLVMTLFQSPVSHDYIRSILRKFQISRYTCNNFIRQQIDHLWIFWSYFPYVSCLGSQGLFSFQICQSIAQKRNPNAADSFNEWQLPLSKLKTSQVSVALNRLLKVLIATNTQRGLFRTTDTCDILSFDNDGYQSSKLSASLKIFFWLCFY